MLRLKTYKNLVNIDLAIPVIRRKKTDKNFVKGILTNINENELQKWMYMRNFRSTAPN